MKKIFVCSPFANDPIGNYQKAKEYCRWVAGKGLIPFAPHLIYTQILDDTKESQRDFGLACGLSFLKHCDELWYFAPGGIISNGMRKEIDFANSLGIPVHEKVEEFSV